MYLLIIQTFPFKVDIFILIIAYAIRIKQKVPYDILVNSNQIFIYTNFSDRLSLCCIIHLIQQIKIPIHYDSKRVY